MKHLLFLWLFLFTARTVVKEPIVVTRVVVETAVPPFQPPHPQ